MCCTREHETKSVSKRLADMGLATCSPQRKGRRTGKQTRKRKPQWVTEAWAFLLRKELGLSSKDPSWLDLPAMMRMVLTTPNILKNRRPDWLGPFNFFLFPQLSELGGYPLGFDKSNFLFITPMETDRRKWRYVKGINLTSSTDKPTR